MNMTTILRARSMEVVQQNFGQVSPKKQQEKIIVQTLLVVENMELDASTLATNDVVEQVGAHSIVEQVRMQRQPANVET